MYQLRLVRDVPGVKDNVRVVSLADQSASITFGRSPDCDVFLDSQKFQNLISRKHAVVRFSTEDNAWVVEDQNSTNGILINSIKKQRSVLTPGDTLWFARAAGTPIGSKVADPHCELVYVFEDASNPQSTPLKRRATGDAEEAASAPPTKSARGMDPERMEKILEMEAKLKKMEEENTILMEKLRKEEEAAREADKTKQEEAEQLRAQTEGLRAQTEQLRAQLGEHQAEKEKVMEAMRRLQNDAVQLDEVAQNLECNICMELFVYPVTLACSHSFCNHCIAKWMSDNKPKPVCPHCRVEIKETPRRTIILEQMVEKVVEKMPEDERKQHDERLAKHNPKAQAAASAGAAAAAAVAAAAAAAAESEEEDEEEEDEEPVRYRSYGYCYRCGRRGHWAPDCRYRS